MELQKIPEGDVLISTDGSGDMRGSDFPNSDISIRVFNADFVKDNVFLVEGKDMPPIIDLGSESKERHERLVNKQKELEDAESDYAGRQSEHHKAKSDLDSYDQSRSKIIKDMLLAPGADNYSSYNKSKYRRQVEELGDGDMTAYHIGDREKNNLLYLSRATRKPPIPEPEYPKPKIATLREKVACLLSRTVVSKPIQSLRSHPVKDEWVLRGMNLRNANECPFCERRISKRRQFELEGHFSPEYMNLVESLDVMVAEVNDVKESCLSELKSPDCEKIHDHLFDEYEKAKAALNDYRDRLEKYFDSLTAALELKRRRLFDHTPSYGVLGPPDNGALDDLVAVIRKHNDACGDLERAAVEARKSLERDRIARDLPERKRLRDNAEDARKAADESETYVASLRQEVSELEQEISNHARSALEFNRNLRGYLGYEDLKLDVRENGYAVVRDGSNDPVPSEGEKTAIALLYFLQSLKSNQFDMEKSIVVLDDPVSSLDGNMLYMAYSFIREHTKCAGQLLILTHNFTFFREVAKWFNHGKKSQLYMLYSRSGDRGRNSVICELDPLLKDYGSDYHYLFGCVWRGAKCANTFEFYYPLPNMARRLLETFLAFCMPDKQDSLRKMVDGINFNEMKKRRILEFTNAHSHNSAIAKPEHDMDRLGETPDVLSDILDLMKEVNPVHYGGMERLVMKGSHGSEGQT